MIVKVDNTFYLDEISLTETNLIRPSVLVINTFMSSCFFLFSNISIFAPTEAPSRHVCRREVGPYMLDDAGCGKMRQDPVEAGSKSSDSTRA